MDQKLLALRAATTEAPRFLDLVGERKVHSKVEISDTAMSVFFADFSIPRIVSKFSLFGADEIHARWLSTWDTQKTLPEPVRPSARRYS
ncbi:MULTISPECIES: hypothetical protein [Agrobacterium]|jgi:hypothetical protein|uniref:hypothetical protein n=1 Tax=Agrobacterium TaxID=357 RepID=UPI001FAA4FB8|nr:MULTISPECIES: hypothetical protein [Agrobacterium]MCZ7889676.1 hypothetical protein [Agrobacterium salinitolerans]UNZ53971.1 hypothetical protein MLE07_25135 [Agrobacterium tumefaciens]